METMSETTFENGTPQFPIEELWVDSVSVVSVDADWQKIAGEYGEGYQSYEAPETESGDYATWNAEAREWQDGDGNEVDPFESDLTGPMMSYYYPLPDLRRVGDDVNEAASRIRDLPLCVVEFEAGGYALALTGGGMDLSWEICEAFTRLGFLPPLHFCDLPGMSGYPRGADHRYVIRACMRSAEVAEGWAASTRARLAEKYGEVI